MALHSELPIHHNSPLPAPDVLNGLCYTLQLSTEDITKDVKKTIKPEDARLVFCKPRHPAIIDPNEHYQYDLPEDGEVSATLLAAFDALNKVIEAEKPLSWWEGDEAVVLPAGFLEHAA